MRAAGEATRRRILLEATKEFAEHGLAGARINRIATRARASKERLYAYFPSKDALFEAVTGDLVEHVSAAATLDGYDAPAYVGSLFDVFVAEPDVMRLIEWMNLEVREGVPAGDWRLAIFEPKLEEIERGQREGAIDTSLDPVELMFVLSGIAYSMAAPFALGRGVTSRGGRRDSVADRR